MITQIKKDMVQAMKNKDKDKLSTLRMLLATIETERGKVGISTVEDFSNEQIETLINRNIKALNNEIQSVLAVGRDASKQEIEKEVLLAYLPTQLTEEEIRSYISGCAERTHQIGASFGTLMRVVSTELKGKADMGLVSRIAKEEFNK